MTTYSWQSSASSSPSPSSTSFLSNPHSQNELKAGLTAENLYRQASGFPVASYGGGRQTSSPGDSDASLNMFSQTPSRSLTGARPRTAQACDKCRTRKAKCSGDHPSCKRCLTRGLECVYASDGRGTRNRGRKAPAAPSKRKTGLSRSTGSSPTLLQPLTIPSLPTAISVSSEASSTRHSSPSSTHSAPPTTRLQMTSVSSSGNNHNTLALPPSEEVLDSPTSYSDHDLELFLPNAPALADRGRSLPTYGHYNHFSSLVSDESPSSSSSYNNQHYSPALMHDDYSAYQSSQSLPPTARSSYANAYSHQNVSPIAAFEPQEFISHHQYPTYSSTGHYQPSVWDNQAVMNPESSSLYPQSYAYSM